MTLSTRATAALAFVGAATIACSGGEKPADTAAAATTDSTASAASAAPAKVAEMMAVRDSAGAAVNFATPEAVKYDEALDGYFVTNINGNPSAKDNNGFIVFVPAERPDSARVLVQGGKGGATLNAPKGMAITGDTLWVADIDAVRGFDKRTGKPVASVTAKGANFLNDVAVGPDGALYITDTGIRFSPTGEMSHPGPDAVLKLAGRTITTAVTFDSANVGPNGIAWDKGASRWIVVPFASKDIQAIGQDGKPAVLVSGVGQFDGIEQAKDGRWLVSTWADSAIYAIPSGGGAPAKLISGVNAPADIGYDSKRNRVLVPLFMDNRVEVYQLQ